MALEGLAYLKLLGRPVAIARAWQGLYDLGVLLDSRAITGNGSQVND